MKLRHRLALAWASDLSAVLRHVETALDSLDPARPENAAAVAELQAARQLLRGGDQ